MPDVTISLPFPPTDDGEGYIFPAPECCPQSAARLVVVFKDEHGTVRELIYAHDTKHALNIIFYHTCVLKHLFGGDIETRPINTH
ncbi:hypothetical protein [Ktedonobacter racemifer]|uniref:Uncharacterized protein n=1 Tax=Ktedonobacter racemifer DSM 44963 TaxID=485913 RepID=D6U8R1_KTERA|nr:hypothetical protein [Ktedonobacter racemifer]EFH79621.1 hypothetical protein Krac_0099 [Ktedonobacter racemifer DSM 44963]